MLKNQMIVIFILTQKNLLLVVLDDTFSLSLENDFKDCFTEKLVHIINYHYGKKI